VASCGLHLFGKFRSRFLFGSDSNILVDRLATNDTALVNAGFSPANSTNVNLYHKAVGASKFRVHNIGGAWSAWQPYTSLSAWSLSPGNGLKQVEVQYWADGSAAYYVNGSVQVQEEALATNRVPISWLQQYGFTNNFDAAALADQDGEGLATWQEYYSGTDPTNSASVWRIALTQQGGTNHLFWPSISNRLYSVTWSTNPLGPWSPLATALFPTPPQNNFDDPVRTGVSEVYYRVSVRLP